MRSSRGLKFATKPPAAIFIAAVISIAAAILIAAALLIAPTVPDL
jgi:hypothetical protein